MRSIVSLLVCSALLLAGPAHAASGPSAFMPLDVELPPASEYEGPLLARVDPAIWMPVLETEGYIAALWTAQEYVHEEDEDLDDFTTMWPLGDATGDGRDDIVTATFDMDEDEVLLKALSGARESKVIWEKEFDMDDEFAYFGGDFDEDGVADLVVIDMEESTGSSEEWHFTFKIAMTVLSGADLSTLTTVTTEGEASYNPSDDLILMGERRSTSYAKLPFMEDLWNVPGYSVITLHLHQEDYQSGIIVATEQGYSYTIGIVIDRYTLAHEKVFTAGAEDLLLVWAGDINADAMLDLLFATEIGSYSYSGGMLDNIPNLGLPIVQPEEEEPEPIELIMIDGATGATVWTEELPVEGQDFLYITTGGNMYGTGATLALINVVLEIVGNNLNGYDFYLATNLILFDGATGTMHDEHLLEDEIVIPSYLGDADEDGLAELMLFRFGLDNGNERIQAVNADLSTIWDMSIASSDLWGISDMNGDGVSDLVTADDDDVGVRDGRDTEQIWEIDIDDLEDLTMTYDIDLDGGYDLGVLRFEDLGDDVDGGYLDLLNGADGTTIWTKQIFEADHYDDVRADEVYVSIGSLGDVDGDGASDLNVFLGGWSDCEDDCDDGHMFSNIALDAADGHTFLRYDTMALADGLDDLPEIKAQRGPAGKLMDSRLDKGLPGLELVFAALAILALADVARRR